MSVVQSPPVRTIIQSYVRCEQGLAEVLDVIPYTDKHEDVWSPRLVSVVLDACSQLDSFWRAITARSNGKDAKNIDITNHFESFARAQDLGSQWVVLFATDDPRLVRPFQAWHDTESYEALLWWKAYNCIKHDRLASRHKATIGVATEALAGIFLAIVRSGRCKEQIPEFFQVSASPQVYRNWNAWLSPDTENDATPKKLGYVAVETRLFSHPFHWCSEPVAGDDEWEGNCLPRFENWFGSYTTTTEKDKAG